MIHTRRARVGIVGMGHFVYWPQFEGLVDELKQKQKIDAKYFANARSSTSDSPTISTARLSA